MRPEKYAHRDDVKSRTLTIPVSPRFMRALKAFSLKNGESQHTIYARKLLEEAIGPLPPHEEAPAP